MAVLTVDHGPDKGKKLILRGKQDIAICGSEEGVALQLTDPLISSQHFRLIKKGEDIFLMDLGNGEPVFVNDVKVTKAKLKTGDIIHVGDTYISVEEETKKGEAKKTKTFAGYELLEKIGVGGMGVVYKARQVNLDRIVALKILSPTMTQDKAFVKRFLDEAKVAGSLTHSNVVQVHDVGEENGTYYICMEYVGGGNLSDILREQGRLDIETAARIALDIARGLQFAETKGIVHCDIKPDNIMISEYGVAKLADLGIARKVSEKQEEEAEEVLGSPHYMAPEQAQGRPVDHRTDLYALGCTIFRMIAGRTPFIGITAREVMKKHIVEEPPDLREFAPEVSAAFAGIVRKLMAKNPDDRYASATELIAALEEIQHNLRSKKGKTKGPKSVVAHAVKRGAHPPIAPRPGVTVERVRRQKIQSNPLPFLPFAIGAVLLVVLLIVLYSQLKPDPALQVYERASALYEQGAYLEALTLLHREGKTSDQELAKQITALKQDCQLRLEEKQAEEAFQKVWNAYEEKKRNGASPDQLREDLKKMKKAYTGTPFYNKVSDEYERLK